jgi:hypothetical protein
MMRPFAGRSAARSGLSGNLPPELAEGLLKSSALEATGYEKLTGVDQIFLRLFYSPALRSDIQWRAMRNVPATRFFKDTDELKLCFDLDLHTLDIPGNNILNL